MNNFKGKLAVVTGASSGIGAATAKALYDIGMEVVGFARRKERIDQIIDQNDGRLIALKVDLTKDQEIIDAFAWIAKNLGPIHVLVNNAGIATPSCVVDGNLATWRNIIDTNFTSVLLSCREGIKNMQQNHIDGYIINVSSLNGKKIMNYDGAALYTSSKFALCTVTENLRLELARMKSQIRVTCLNPGMVKTEVMSAAGRMSQDAAEAVYERCKHLLSEDVANTIVYLINTPQHVNVTDLTIQPTGESM